MSEKTYPDETGYDPTIGMSEDIQRFEYILWFKGEWINPMDIAEAVTKFLQDKDVQQMHAQYGTMMVPTEDVGIHPYYSLEQEESA